MHVSNRDKDMEILAGERLELRRQLAAKDREIAALLLLLREIRDNAWPGTAFGARIDIALSRLPYDAPAPNHAGAARGVPESIMTLDTIDSHPYPKTELVEEIICDESIEGTNMRITGVRFVPAPAPDPAEYVMDTSVTTPYPYQELKYSSGGISTPAPDPTVDLHKGFHPLEFQPASISGDGPFANEPAPDPAEAMRDEIAELKEELDQWREVFVDERGEVWRRPTAWAYAQACCVRHELEAELAALKGNGEGT